MRISPITYTRISPKTSFKQNSDKKLSKTEAQKLLDNYETVTKEHFKDGFIYKGLAKLYFGLDGYYSPEHIMEWQKNYETMEKLYKKNKENLKKMYIHALLDLGLKIEELRMDIAIKEASTEGNYPLLKLMISDMDMKPIKPDGYVDSKICGNIFFQDRNDIKELFENVHYTCDKPIYGDYVQPANDNLVILEQAKNMIYIDEQNLGQASVETIDKIVSNPNFYKIKDEDLNISGSKILHLLAEAPFNKKNKKEKKLVKNIIKNCEDIEYNFDIKNKFGETAADRANEAKNKFLSKLISERIKNEDSKDNYSII